MSRAVNLDAWAILLPDEQTALSIQLGENKSSWQVGEMMDKSHYKYLEIKYRAEKFLKMFTEYLELYQSVIPPYVTGDEVALEYFRYVVIDRNKPEIAFNKLRTKFGISRKKKELNARLLKVLQEWKDTNDAHCKSALELILDFDRWNNFRVLPREIQEPSAFKRRLKNRHKKHLNTLTRIHPLALMKLEKVYKTKKAPYNFLPLISGEDFFVLKVKDTKRANEDFNNLGFYIFKDEQLAKEYIEACHAYQFKKGYRECRDGLDFWPKYRDYIKGSINYEQIQQITPSRKFLDIAMEKLKFI